MTTREHFLNLLRGAVSAGQSTAGLDSSGCLLQWAQRASVDEQAVARAMAESLSLPFAASLSQYGTSADFVTKIPIGFARRCVMLGCTADDGSLVLVLGDVKTLPQMDVVSRLLHRPARLVLAPRTVVLTAINEAYQQQDGQAQACIEALDQNAVLEQVQALSNREDLLDVASRAPVIKLVNLMLFEAVKGGASDVHVQPYEQRLIVRLRIDGVLYNMFELPKAVQEEVISRVKVMGRMNIAEKRLPQDGRATVQVGDALIDLRIASLPTSCGERVVIRLLDKSARLYQLAELGMDALTLRSFRRLIGVEHGLLLVTGPTGSGKTTTLYSALKELDSDERNILTLEDPIEYQFEGISQTQVSEKKGMTFASGLRSVLRQDPDVIMVGEIRDRETATMAIQSALTGHLVFSTLHTNDAASAVTRLLDLGIEPYLAASSLIGVLAQRLVRRVCPSCGHLVQPSSQDRHWLGLNGEPAFSIRAGSGCSICRNTGYRGRVGIFELLSVDEATRRLIQERATASQISHAAAERGMKTLRDDGITKIIGGATTIAEVERVTMRSADVDDLEPPPDAAMVSAAPGLAR